jgi:flagellar basal-body rod modification protein FlgD
MATDAIGSALGLGLTKQATNPAKSEIDGAKLADDFSSFLKLLTTQLQNQDPTEPLDTNEFTNQLVLFSGVEQQLATNKNLEKLVAASSTTGIQQGLGYIGKAIDAVGNKGVLVDKSAVFAYELPKNASTVDVSIVDATGRAVFSGTGSKQEGKNLVVWDGVNSFTQQAMADGTYQIVVNAKDFKNEKIEVKTYTTGRVTSTELDKDGNTVLNVGNAKIPVGDVLAVREIPTNVSTKPATTTTTTTPPATASSTTPNTSAASSSAADDDDNKQADAA